MWSRRALVAFAVLFTLAGAACSSSSSSQSTTTTTTSSAPPTTVDKLAHIKQVCQQSNDALGAAAKSAFGNQQPTTAQWQPFMVSTVLPLIEERLQAMSADAAAQDPTIKKAIDAGNAAVISARDNPQQLSPSTQAPFDDYDSLVTAAGISDCGVGG